MARRSKDAEPMLRKRTVPPDGADARPAAALGAGEGALAATAAAFAVEDAVAAAREPAGAVGRDAAQAEEDGSARAPAPVSDAGAGATDGAAPPSVSAAPPPSGASSGAVARSGDAPGDPDRGHEARPPPERGEAGPAESASLGETGPFEGATPFGWASAVAQSFADAQARLHLSLREAWAESARSLEAALEALDPAFRIGSIFTGGSAEAAMRARVDAAFETSAPRAVATRFADGASPDPRAAPDGGATAAAPNPAVILETVATALETFAMSSLNSPFAALFSGGGILSNLAPEDDAPLSVTLSGGAAAGGLEASTLGAMDTRGYSSLSSDVVHGEVEFSASSAGGSAEATTGAAVSGADIVIAVSVDQSFGIDGVTAVSKTNVIALNFPSFDFLGGPVVLGYALGSDFLGAKPVYQLPSGLGAGRFGETVDGPKAGVGFSSSVVDAFDLSEAIIASGVQTAADEAASLSLGTSTVEIF